MQRLFGPEGPWPTPWMERSLPAIAAMLWLATVIGIVFGANRSECSGERIPR
jgi:hypothetical protein